MIFGTPRDATRWKWLRRGALLAALGVAATSLGACGGAGNDPAVSPVNPALAIDADPLALFPAGAVVLSSLDARAFYASGTAAGQIAALAEGVLPLGQEVGLVASRDVDHLFVALYAGAALDGVAVLSGRFDPARIQAAVAAHATGRSGLAWVPAPYAGRTLYASTNVAFSVLTDHTLAVGSESAVRRVLDHLAQRGLPASNTAPGVGVGGRELPDWMLQVVQAPGTSFGLAADVASIPPAALHGLPLPSSVSGLTRLAVQGDFQPPGLNIASNLTYVDPSRATAGADSLRQLAAFVAVASHIGAAPQVQNLAITPNGPTVAITFGLDDAAIRKSIASVMQFLGGSPGPR